MKFRLIKKIDGYQIFYGKQIKTGTIINLEGDLAAKASGDSDFEVILDVVESVPAKAAPAKKATPKKKSVKKGTKKSK